MTMRSKKILFSAILILAIVFASVGFCFAESFSAFPPVGSLIAEVPISKQFFCWYADATGYTTSNPLYIFNSLGVYENSYGFSFIFDGQSTSIFGEGNYLYFGFNVNGELVFMTSSTYTEGRFNLNIGSSLTNPQFGGSSITASDLGIVLGDSYEFGSQTVGEVFDFTLPSGYALVIQGDCEILERNYSITNSWNFTNSDGNRVNGSSERLLAFGNVVDGFSPDKNLSRSSLIQWQALNANIQGTASNYSFNANDLVSVPSGSCFVISYPNLYGYGSSNATITFENSVDLVGNVYFQYSGDRPTVRVVALESLSEYSSSGQFSTYSVFRPAVKNEVLTPSGVSDDGHTILTPSSPLPSGGGNSGQPPVDEDNSLLGVLQRLSNQITGLFNSAIDAIHNLVSQGSLFMNNLASMFTWLPQPVYTVLVSALIVLIIIGVVKLLF